MTATRDRIEDLVLRIQSDFLDNPTLALTQPAAEKRFGIDEVTCAGVLGALEGPECSPDGKVPIAGTFHDSPHDKPPESSKRLRSHPNPEACTQETVMVEIRRILCPVDFSDFSRRALDHAIAIARWYESTVTCTRT